jgi:GntR family transcriptional regulator
MCASRHRLARKLLRQDGPLYRQAATHLRAAITGGGFAVGAELPTEAELAQGFGVSLITLRHALRELEGEGLIRKRPAKNAIVVSATPRMPMARQLNSLEDVVAATHEARLEIISYGRRRDAEAALEFGLEAGAALYCLRGRMVVREQPVSTITIFFPPQIGSRLTRADFDDVVVFRSVERRLGLRLSGARITVNAELADAELARRLDYAEGAPVLVNRMLYTAEDGRPVELTIARHRADRYSLTYELRTG